MLTDYTQNAHLSESRYAIKLFGEISRMDINPLHNTALFSSNRAIGLYSIDDGHVVSGAILKLNEELLTKHDKWALSSPIVHPFLIRDSDDLTRATRCEWIDDVLTHPGASNICMSQLMAYRIKCYMRKLFNPNHLPTPQLIVWETSPYSKDMLTFIYTGQGN